MRTVIRLWPAALVAACAAMAPREPPRRAPLDRAMDFEATRLDGGGRLRLSDLRGKVVLVDFFASWCAPCRESFPFYQSLRTRLGADFEVLAVAVDDEREPAERFVREMDARFPAVWDEGQRIVATWEAPAMPTAYLVDRLGVVRLVHAGFGGDAPGLIEPAARALLRSPRAAQ